MAISVALTLIGCASVALGQVPYPSRPRFPNRPPVVRPNAGAGRRAAAKQAAGMSSDPGAIALLRQMLHPLLEFSAEEQTWIAQGGGAGSRQTIKGDTKGNLVRTYMAPGYLQGDIMLTGPNRYAYYHAGSRTLTEAPAGGQEDERDKRIVEGLKNRTFIARRTGNEMVAGRNAIIVVVSPANPRQQGYAKFWIDPATGIKLKIEIANEANSKVSTSELSNLVTGPAANVSPRDFMKPGQSVSPANEVKRERVATVQEAMALLPFRPLEPGNVPSGYQLKLVQVVTGANRVGLFLRYTDGVNVFTLTEHKIRARMRPGANAANPGAEHWFVAVGDYDIDIVYRGHLPAQQEQAVHDSLQPVR